MTNSLSTIPINRLNPNELNEKINMSVEEKADIDLSNLSTVGQDILDNKLNKQMISNCLTHIPQDIKLELNNGTLTLKAGSKVWIPYGTTEAYQVGDIDAYGNTVVATSWDGSKFFYAIELQSDTSQNFSRTDTSKRLAFMELNTSLSGAVNIGSGTSPVNDTLYYRTDNNTIGYYMSDGSFIQSSLPLGVCVADGTYMFGSIEQVFNGFGYIGSTVFALPGVKGLVPNGRNADGSLNNVEWIINNVITRTLTNSGSNHLIALNPNEPKEGYLFGIISTSNFYYNLEENRNYNLGGNEEWQFTPIMLDVTLTSGVISNFNLKTTFQAVDYNSIPQHIEVSTLPANPNSNTFYYIPE